MAKVKLRLRSASDAGALPVIRFAPFPTGREAADPLNPRAHPQDERGSLMSEITLDGRVAIVTGAGGGLGRSHAIALAQRGALVVVNDLGGALDGSGGSQSAAQLVVDQIVAEGGTAVANFDSVATPEGGEAIVQAAVDAFGRVDIVVNNAGILRDKAFHKMETSMVDAVIDVHLKGAFYVSRPAFILMRQQGFGRIISTTSASGVFGNFGQANYGAAKAGLVGLTRVLAQEGAMHGVKANAIAPIALTRMTEGILGDLSSKVSPDTVSPMVVYLASENCEESGHVYSVAGGRIARIAIMETPGVVFDELSPEVIGQRMSDINGRDVASFVEPGSLDDETKLIARALQGGSIGAARGSEEGASSSAGRPGFFQGLGGLPSAQSAVELSFDLAEEVFSSQREFSLQLARIFDSK
jgi:NAD(P)-dependent dehydrogenase (short-subunit alcohol dehydrogenase family)